MTVPDDLVRLRRFQINAPEETPAPSGGVVEVPEINSAGRMAASRLFARLEYFDTRSRSFPISSILPQAAVPRSYSWRVREHFDQGSDGACVAFSLGHELNARPAEVAGITPRWLVEKVYWEAQKIDPWPGGAYPGASPRYEGTSVLAGVKVLHKMGAFEEYRWAFGLQDLIRGVAYNGPAIIGVNWYSGMLNTTASGFIYPTGSLLGGHAVLVRGVNVKERRFTIRNSWGKNWGMNGDAYISFSDMEALLHNRGEAVFAKKRTAKNFSPSY
jgi:hypothetical protein